MYSCQLGELKFFIDMNLANEYKKSETRNQFTSIEQLVLGDLSGDKARELIQGFTTSSATWTTIAAQADPALAKRGQHAFQSAELILRKLWENAHGRPLA